MIDLNDWKRRLTALAQGCDLSEDSGYEVFRDNVAEATESTRAGDLRELARGLGVERPAMRRDDIVEEIVASWVDLDEAGRAYVADADGLGTSDEFADALVEIAEQMRRAGRAFGAFEIERLRDALAVMMDAAREVTRVR
jgi:hypothetical protein